MLDLQAIFGNGVVVTAAVAQPMAVPAPIPRPEVLTVPTPAADPLAAEWETVPDWDDLPLPGASCPRCGSLEKWFGQHGGEHCQHCEAETLEKSFQWADRAVKLREQAQPQKPAPRIASCCVAGGMVESKHIGGNVA